MPMLSTKEAYMRVLNVYNDGRYRSALRMSEPLYRQLPHHPPVVALYVSCLLRVQRAEEAAAIARRSLQTVTNNAHRTSIISTLAGALKQLGAFDEATELLSTEIAQRPDDPYLVDVIGHLYSMNSDERSALRVADDAWTRGVHHPAVATAYARGALPEQELRAIAAERLEESLKHADGVPLSTHAMTYTLLGHTYDKMKRYPEAMSAYRARNELYPELYNDDAVRTRCEQLKAAWTPENFVGIERPAPSGPRPVFIIGMPRSGSTLTEQILDAHPDVFGAGELEIMNELFFNAAPKPAEVYSTPPSGYEAARLRETASQYREQLIKASGDSPRPVIVDKALGNFWYMGFIALAFPDAKIVHCQRDPRDTCLSCYFQPLDPSHAFSFDLRNCGRFYRHYHDITQHMTNVLRDPRVGIDVLEMHYEETVADLESQTRRLLDFIDLDFHEDCLNFHQSKRVAMTLSNDQVRKPIYTSSTKRFERYREHIEPLIEALGDLVEPTSRAEPATDR